MPRLNYWKEFHSRNPMKSLRKHREDVGLWFPTGWVDNSLAMDIDRVSGFDDNWPGLTFRVCLNFCALSESLLTCWTSSEVQLYHSEHADLPNNLIPPTPGPIWRLFKFNDVKTHYDNSPAAPPRDRFQPRENVFFRRLHVPLEIISEWQECIYNVFHSRGQFKPSHAIISPQIAKLAHGNGFRWWKFEKLLSVAPN